MKRKSDENKQVDRPLSQQVVTVRVGEIGAQQDTVGQRGAMIDAAGEAHSVINYATRHANGTTN